MISEIIIDDGMIGAIVSPAPDQFLTTLQTLTPQNPAQQMENFIAIPYPHGRWSAGRFVLRGANRALFSFSTLHGGVCGVGDGVAQRILLLGASIAYRGDLVLECLPRGGGGCSKSATFRSLKA